MNTSFQYHAKAKGYFSPERFSARTGGSKAHELAMDSADARHNRRASPTMTVNGRRR